MTTPMPSGGYRTIYRGAAMTLHRSGKFDSQQFYVWAATREAALAAAKRVYPKATQILVKERSS